MGKVLTPVSFRRLEASSEMLENPVEEIAYQHTVFCQTCLPYKNPDHLRVWERQQGAVYLRIEAGAVRDPKEKRFIDVGLTIWHTAPVDIGSPEPASYCFR